MCRALPGAGTRPHGFPSSEGEALGTAVRGVCAPGDAGQEHEQRGQHVCPRARWGPRERSSGERAARWPRSAALRAPS